MTVLDWLLDSDPAIRWQVLRDLVHAPAEAVAAERARVATEGWGARLLALQGEDGQWAEGACFPAHSFNWRDENQGQPWTATLPTLQLLCDFGVDPCSDRVRRAVALVRDRCRWEHAGQPFFSGEVEPCINGRTVSLGIYFDRDVEALVVRLLGEQLEDGGWNCEAENGSVRSSFATMINVLEGLMAYERATGGSVESIAARRRGGSTFSSESWCDVRVPAKSLTQPGCNSRFQPAGTMTCSVPSHTSARSGMRQTRGWTKRFICSDPESNPTVPGYLRTRIPARSTLRSRTVTVGPAGGTRCEHCVSSAGTSGSLPEARSRVAPTLRLVQEQNGPAQRCS